MLFDFSSMPGMANFHAMMAGGPSESNPVLAPMQKMAAGVRAGMEQVQGALEPIPMLGRMSQTYGPRGAADYPNLPAGSRHHASAAESISGAIGPLATNALGLGVEGVEALAAPSSTFSNPRQRARYLEDVRNDLLANAVGSVIGQVPEAFRGIPRSIIGRLYSGENGPPAPVR